MIQVWFATDVPAPKVADQGDRSVDLNLTALS